MAKKITRKQRVTQRKARGEGFAALRNLRTTPRKARLVADAVRGKNVNEALNLLDFGIKKDVAVDVAKLIRSALASLNSNAEAGIEDDALRVKEIRVDEGPVMKRFRPRAKGSASSVLKRMCHISVTLSN
ncbi:MAG: 50S ribosomal protein L22 [Chitinispirillia bacterium]|nr:50S ribosomal protein L22 [Chitinispirillia bacterium]MCL2241018.1 50S ribosomal protein L22 [Chitinispirillia bacterium]